MALLATTDAFGWLRYRCGWLHFCLLVLVLFGPPRANAEVHSDCFDKQWGVTCAKERVADAKAADAAVAATFAKNGWQRPCFLLQYIGGKDGEAYMILVSMQGKKGGSAPDCVDPVSTTRGTATEAQLKVLAADMKKALLALPAPTRAQLLRRVDSVAVVNGRGGQVELPIKP